MPWVLAAMFCAGAWDERSCVQRRRAAVQVSRWNGIGCEQGSARARTPMMRWPSLRVPLRGPIWDLDLGGGEGVEDEVVDARDDGLAGVAGIGGDFFPVGV